MIFTLITKEKYMTKITEYYLNKASYIAIDEKGGGKIDIDIDYWSGRFKVSRKNQDLEEFVAKLLKKKHKINFAYKLVK